MDDGRPTTDDKAMAIGLLGKKLGMTQVFDPYGRQLAVTAVQAGPCTIVGLRERARDGHDAVQLGFVSIKATKVSKPLAGQFKKSGTETFRYVHEFRVEATVSGPTTDGDQQHTTPTPEGTASGSAAHAAGWSVGQQLTVDMFKQYEFVDVTGTSIGKGFQGGMKRWGWSGGPKSHGSMSHRAPGSIGASAFPSRVFKGHHLPGHMGAEQVTVQNLRIVGVDLTSHVLLIEGAIPGAREGLVIVRKSMKRFEVVKAPEVITIVEEEQEKGKRGKIAVKKK